MVPRPTPIYHITHINNLQSIIAAGGLQTCGELRQTGVNYTDIAYPSLQDRRSTKMVPCGAGGTLHDYVPFYFAPRSPMLYTISRGNVAGYTDGQRPVIYFVSTAQSVQVAGRSFVFTDGHGVMDISNFYTELSELDQIDWEVMKARIWRDTIEYPDRKRRRQAEFLVHKFFPWGLISRIVVKGALVKSQVESILENVSQSPNVEIRADWYYS